MGLRLLVASPIRLRVFVEPGTDPLIDLDALAQAASCLEPLPVSTLRLARLVCSGGDSPDIARVVEVVQFDQALTSSLLRAANSSWSASRSEITNVHDAVVRLGTGPVFSMALGVQVKARLSEPVPEYGLGESDLWNHSVAASLAAELVVRTSPRQLPLETVTASLLHDVGKLVMSRFLSSELLHRLEASRSAGKTRMEAESDVLGVHHAELGGLILQCWALPEGLVRGVTYHHQPDVSINPVAYGVHLADVAAKRLVGGDDDNADPEMLDNALGELELSGVQFDEICGLVETRFCEVLEQFAA